MQELNADNTMENRKPNHTKITVSIANPDVGNGVAKLGNLPKMILLHQYDYLVASLLSASINAKILATASSGIV